MINKKPIEFQFPEYIPPHFYEINKYFELELRNKCIKRFHEYRNREDAPEECFLDIVLWAELAFPNCVDSWILKIVMLFYHFHYWLDNKLETEMKNNERIAKVLYEQLVESFDKLFGEKNVSMLEWKPYIVALHIVFDAVFSTFSQNQKERCAQLTKAFCYRNVGQFGLYDGSILKGSAEDVIKI